MAETPTQQRARRAEQIELQQGYYRAARDRMVRLGEELDLGPAAVATTPGARGERVNRLDVLGRVQTVLYLLLATCAIVDVVGIAYAVG